MMYGIISEIIYEPIAVTFAESAPEVEYSGRRRGTRVLVAAMNNIGADGGVCAGVELVGGGGRLRGRASATARNTWTEISQ
jgi:hypothetical protein